MKVSDVPGTSTVRRMVIRLDCGWMLYRREENAKRWASESWRYISFDASPQAGQEVYCTVERVMSCAEVSVGHNKLSGAPGLGQYQFPIVVLGAGRMGLAEKAQAYVHQMWLEYGPTAAAIRAANGRVRVILSDMGTELGIGDMRDIVDAALAGQCVRGTQPGQSGQSEFMFPRALVVPGPQHILDNVLQSSVEALRWWASYEVALKTVSQWVNPVGNRRAMQFFLRRGGRSEMAKLLSKGVDRFAHWRWKTLGNVVKSLGELEPALRQVLLVTTVDELKRRRKGVGEIEKVWAFISEDSFWARRAWVQTQIAPVLEFAQWVRGCHCCEASRLRASTPVHCEWAGCRATGLKRRWAQALSEVEALRRNAASEHADADLVLGQLLASLQLKMRWVDDGPFLLWQLPSPSVAVRMLGQRDALVQAGGQPHRVVELFLNPDSELRKEMEAHAAGGPVSAQLAREIYAYQWGKIDDTWAEAVHRDASGFMKRCNASHVPYMSASLRTESILEEVLKMKASDQRRFCGMVERWYAVGQSDPKKAVLYMRPRRRVGQDDRSACSNNLAKIYRYDAAAMREWDRDLGAQPLSCVTPLPSLRRSVVARLQVDHLRSTLPLGKVLSITDEAVGQLVVVEGPVRRFVQVLNLDISRQHRLATRDSAHETMMACQAFVQPFVIVGQGDDGQGQASSGQVKVRFDGNPTVVDLLDLCSWSAWASGVRVWEVSDEQECALRSLANEQALDVIANWADLRISAWTCLSLLAEQGWTRGRPPAVFTRESEKVFFAKDPVQSKAYLRCLLGLETLIDGASDGLPSGQTNMYYSCVLAAGAVSPVPVGQSAAVYAVLLKKRSAEGQFPALEDEDEGADSGEEEGGVADDASSDAVFEPLGQSARPKKKQKAARGQRRASTGGSDWAALVWDAGDTASVPVGASSAPLPIADAAQASDGQIAVGEAEASPAAPVPEPEGQDRARLFVLEGVQLEEEYHGVPGTRGAYKRLRAVCQAHAKCRSQRSFSQKFGRASGLGDQEPFAFLGCWLRAAPNFVENPEGHARWKPSTDEVVAYANSMGWTGTGGQ